MNEARDLYEGTSVDLEPSQKAPKPWCPLCDLTIIERYAYCCEECRDALQSEDK
jgi:hypothetical protein